MLQLRTGDGAFLRAFVETTKAVVSAPATAAMGGGAYKNEGGLGQVIAAAAGDTPGGHPGQTLQAGRVRKLRGTFPDRTIVEILLQTQVASLSG